MKKLSLSPLSLDKETIALLDAEQLNDVIGGANHAARLSGVSTCCGLTGSSVCETGGGSTGCTAGSSTCKVGAHHVIY